MKPRSTASLLSVAASWTAMPALAHDGHGLWGAHWHASDTFGFVALTGAIALAVWLSRK